MYTQNYGRPGCIYILENEGLRAGYFKIGCSTRSGDVRARDLNLEAGTGTPGSIAACSSTRRATAAGTERVVFTALQDFRRGKWGQEFFEVDLEFAKATISRLCEEVDATVPLEQPPGVELDMRAPEHRHRRSRGLGFFAPLAFIALIAGYLLLRTNPPMPRMPKPVAITGPAIAPRISSAASKPSTDPTLPSATPAAPKQVDLAKLRPVVLAEMGKASGGGAGFDAVRV